MKNVSNENGITLLSLIVGAVILLIVVIISYGIKVKQIEVEGKDINANTIVKNIEIETKNEINNATVSNKVNTTEENLQNKSNISKIYRNDVNTDIHTSENIYSEELDDTKKVEITESEELDNKKNIETTESYDSEETYPNEELKKTEGDNIGNQIIDGVEVIGNLEIPKTGVNFPIVSQVKEDLILESLTFYMYGPGINQPGRTTIVGSNVAFERNNELEIGETFYITDNENQKIAYEIFDTYIVDSANVEYMNDTTSEKEIVLYFLNVYDLWNKLIIIGREI